MTPFHHKGPLKSTRSDADVLYGSQHAQIKLQLPLDVSEPALLLVPFFTHDCSS